MAGPVRMCIGCRGRAAAAELLRVVARDGLVRPDVRRREPGRGAHLHPDPACLDLADRRRAFARALRVPGPLDVTPVREVLGTGLDAEVTSVAADHRTPGRAGKPPTR